MEYVKIKFTVGLDCEAYQEISDGVVTAYKDLDGNVLILPEVTESHVIDAQPPKPVWGE